MAECQEYTHLISAALDGELPPREQADLDAHLARCPQCRELMDQLSDLRLELTQLPPLQPPPQLKDNIMAAVALQPVPKGGRRWTKALACAAVVAVVLTAAWQLGRTSPMVGGDPAYDETTAETAEDDAAPDRGGSAEAGAAPNNEVMMARVTTADAADAALTGGAAPQDAPVAQAAPEEAAGRAAQKNSAAETFDAAGEIPYAVQADRDVAAPISVPSGAPIQALLEARDGDPYSLSPDAETLDPNLDPPVLPPL